MIFLDTSLGSKNPSKNRPRQRGPPQFTKGTGHELCVEQADWWHHETSSLARKPFASAAGCHGCMQLKKLPIGLVRTQVWALCLKSASTLLLCKSSTRSAANCCPQENQLPTDIAHHSSQGLHELCSSVRAGHTALVKVCGKWSFPGLFNSQKSGQTTRSTQMARCSCRRKRLCHLSRGPPWLHMIPDMGYISSFG